MAVTVTNLSVGKVSLPFPFSATLTAGASKSVADLKISQLPERTRNRLTDMQNSGLVTVAETDDTMQRGSPQDASVADVHQLLSVGQGTAANGSVESVAYVERPSYLKSLTCYFDAVPAVTETITITLTRNGQSILNAAFVVDNTSTLPSESATPLANDIDNTDGAVLAADSDEFSSAGATFTDAHIGNLIFINGGHTNDGAYIIDGRTDGNNVDVINLDGTDPAFTDESSLKWDMYLSLQIGDILSLGATVANATNLNYWSAMAVLVPR